MFITGEVGELYMEKLVIKSDTTATALLSMNDATGLLQSLTLDDVVFNGGTSEGTDIKAIFPDAGQIYGKLDIKNCKFQNIDAVTIIDTVTGTPALHALNPGFLESVNFHKNTISGSRGHVAFRGRLDKPITTVTITENTMSTYDQTGTTADAALIVTNPVFVFFFHTSYI